MPRLSDYLFEKIKKVNSDVIEKRRAKKQKQLQKNRQKKGEIVLRDIDDEE